VRPAFFASRTFLKKYSLAHCFSVTIWYASRQSLKSFGRAFKFSRCVTHLPPAATPPSRMSNAAPAAALYPPAHVAARAIEILSRLPGNHFTLPTPSPLPDPCAPARSQELGPCWKVSQLPTGDDESGEFYFGRDCKGYVNLMPRSPLTEWPRVKGNRPRPLRLTRWIMRAPPGVNVLHACDQPACVRAAHLRFGSQAENLRDAIERGRRRLGGSPTSSVQASRRPTRRHDELTPATAFPCVDDARERAFCVAGFASPTKVARKLARGRAQRALAP
jgi:hypothetical protein